MATSKVKGHVSPGYEPVKDHLQKMLDSGCEDKLQLCVYVGKKCVVDLSASFNPDDQSYSADTMQCVFSSGKTVASIIVAKLVEQGLMNYGDKIVTHWPNFAAVMSTNFESVVKAIALGGSSPSVSQVCVTFPSVHSTNASSPPAVATARSSRFGDSTAQKRASSSFT